MVGRTPGPGDPWWVSRYATPTHSSYSFSCTWAVCLDTPPRLSVDCDEYAVWRQCVPQYHYCSSSASLPYGSSAGPPIPDGQVGTGGSRGRPKVACISERVHGSVMLSSAWSRVRSSQDNHAVCHPLILSPVPCHKHALLWLDRYGTRLYQDDQKRNGSKAWKQKRLGL